MQHSSPSGKAQSPWWHVIFLFVLWLGINIVYQLWLNIDQKPPGWDEANHLTGSLNYLAAFWQFSDWEEFWRVSTKYPPLTYIVAALCQIFIGKGSDQALGSNFIFSGILVWAVFSIGKRLFNSEVGFWGAAITLLIPRLIYYRVNFITDSALVSFTVLSFACLTHWYFAEKRAEQWKWITAFGVCLGLALMTKLSAATKLTPNRALMHQLRDAGRRQMDRFLDAHFDDLNTRGTVDLRKMFA